MSSLEPPTPLEPLPQELHDKRLWIGNLDTRLNEYQLLKILQPFGRIEKFDLLFHRSGPFEGQPRGYAFVTYKESSEAIEAKIKLHGVKIGSKYVAVKWANSINIEDYDKTKVMPDISALTGAKPEANSSTQTGSAIEAIEEKLRMMENSSVEPDFSEQSILALQLPPTQIRPIAVSQKREKFYSRKRPYMKSRKR